MTRIALVGAAEAAGRRLAANLLERDPSISFLVVDHDRARADALAAALGGPIGLVIGPGKRDEVDIILEPQLPQHVQRTIRDPGVGRVGEGLGEHKHARPSAHVTSQRAVFASPIAIATRVYSMSV